MKPKPLSCDRELLRRSLHDSLSEEQENELIHHLSECAACQRDLERLAGGTELSHIVEILRQEAESCSCGWAGDSPEVIFGFRLPGEGHVNELADFAVDFLDPPTTPRTLGRLGDIDIQELIGRGSMGIVLKGFHKELDRPVAVKVLAPHLATSGAARKRFAREAQATAVIVHPNVMPILTVNSSDRLPYLVMPYTACESLQHRLDREGPLDAVDALRIGMQVAGGLAAAHAQGLVHRDVKPANILLEKGVHRVMLTDFGLARAVDDATLTRTGVIAGTPQYMSPEQARGESISALSDQFSLGSVLYAMCTGRPPFRAESSYGILRRITDTEPRPIREINREIPVSLCEIVERLHSKTPQERFATTEEVAVRLGGWLAHAQQPTSVPAPARLSRSESQRAKATVRRRHKTIAACVAAIGLLMTMGFWMSQAWRQSPSSDESRAMENLKRIGTAMRVYHRVNGRFPPAVLRGPDGKTLYSWRVALLPLLGQKALHDRYRFDEPWDGPNNRQLIDEMPAVYRCPGDRNDSINTSYFVITGPRTVFTGDEGSRIRDFQDGTSNTLLVVEAKRSTPWTKPEDLTYDPKGPLPKLGGFFPKRFCAVLADGTPKSISNELDEDVLRALIMKDDGGFVADALPPAN